MQEQISIKEKESWRQRYIDRLISQADISKDFATDIYLAGKNDIDYETDPTDAADEELSYWCD